MGQTETPGIRALLVALSLVLAPAGANAGAWPRGLGETFLSFSHQSATGARTLVEAARDIRSYSSIYAEYGLTERLTIGLDAAAGTGEDEKVWSALAFARLPVWSPGEHRVAVELGLGTRASNRDDTQTRIRPGLSWGRGFTSRRGGGWLGIDSSIEYRTPGAELVYKADFTLGLKPNDRWMVIMQLQTGHYPDDGTLVRLAPSVVRRLGPRAHLQLGAIAEIAGGDAIGLKTAVWFSF